MAEATNIYQALRSVQVELKAPKGQFNSFGKYSYRNQEDILEAVKPVLARHNLTLIVTDTLENIGDRYYVKATAQVTDGTDFVEAHAYAREDDDKKGMDSSQLTGSTSSYARKYALNGLFLIDDTKDADTDEHSKATLQTRPPMTVKTVANDPPAVAVEHVKQVFPEAEAQFVRRGGKPLQASQSARIYKLGGQLGIAREALEARVAQLNTEAAGKLAIEKLEQQLQEKGGE